ncbi:MAG TPA: hypothetical protein VJL59_12240 [Anaerolineales bacterium]|nr:hypothetical protein [Anaerolineales bacterium]
MKATEIGWWTSHPITGGCVFRGKFVDQDLYVDHDGRVWEILEAQATGRERKETCDGREILAVEFETTLRPVTEDEIRALVP